MTDLSALRGAIMYQQLQLEALEKQLFDLENPMESRPMTEYDLVEKIIDLAKDESPNYKKLWKEAVVKHDLFSNVQTLLADCWNALHDSDCAEDAAEPAKERLGDKIGCLKWQLFCIDVMKYLRVSGCFVDEDGSFDTFEDTAGGCDETTWEAALYVIQNPNWTLEDVKH